MAISIWKVLGWLLRHGSHNRLAASRAVDVQWLSELSNAHISSLGAHDYRGTICRLVSLIEGDYDAYHSVFPDLDDRLSGARVALRIAPTADSLAQLRFALAEEVRRRGL